MQQLPTPLKTLVILVLAAAFGGFVAIALQGALDRPAQAAPAPASAANAATAVSGLAALPPTVEGQVLPSLAPMLQRVMPAVVSVHTKQRVRINNPFFNDPIFRRMFPNVPLERIQQSLGSGVIVDAQRGLVLTNHHVIENADEVSVTLADGRTVAAEFLGSDPETDVALMKIQADGLTALPLADSDALRVGDFVVAIGNPFGFNQTVTSGIVSAVGRNGIPGLGYQNFIQTDASINPGNSGGALVNLRGELVGINTATFNPRGSRAGDIGLGFAIPSNLAGGIMHQLLANDGVVRRGTLGVEAQNIDQRLADGLGLASTRGALVTRVYPESAAAKAGLQAGDVIVAANDQRIDNGGALHNFEGLQAVGTAVTLDVLRDGKTLEIATTLREAPRSLAGAMLDPRLDGAILVELPDRLRQAGIDGVLVKNVAAGSRAARNRLNAGDVLLAVNGHAIDSLAGLRAGFASQPAQLILHVQRGSAQGTLPMQ